MTNIALEGLKKIHLWRDNINNANYLQIILKTLGCGGARDSAGTP